jgi:hypothetical protein
MYPYNLSINPFPSSPTPTLREANILGGKRHKEARDIIIECINSINKMSNKKDFRLVTLIQDVGSGKTHLALHIKSTQDNIVCSYVDLSTLFPRELKSLYNAILEGFGNEYIKELRSSIINHIKRLALEDNKVAKKFFRPSFFNRNIERLAEEILNGKRVADTSYINNIFNYEPSIISLIKSIIDNNIKNVNTLDEILTNLAGLAKLNMDMLNKVTVIEIDELDEDKDATDFTKAMINAHIPYTVMLLITTPVLYNKIRDANPSLFDRIEKANYKIDLAGTNLFEEIADIVLEYIRVNVKDSTFSSYESDIINKLKVIYDEFKEFRNIRSMLNIMYHTMEIANKRNSSIITEEVLDETITHAYPGLRVKGSIMNVPISEFIKIRRAYNNDDILESSIKNAIKSLLVFAHEKGKVTSEGLEIANTSDIDAIYIDDTGKKIGIVVTINKDHTKIFERINKLEKKGIDKLVVLTNANTINQGTNAIVSLDKCKMVDLIYFDHKYKEESIEENDGDRALILARSILLC